MSVREQYKLRFNKFKQNDGRLSFFISEESPKGGDNSILLFIHHLDKGECESLIDDLNKSLSAGYAIDEGFYSDSVEHVSILYVYPNVEIDDLLILPMQHLRTLAEEWLAFKWG